jgi:hypothetical protein
MADNQARAGGRATRQAIGRRLRSSSGFATVGAALVLVMVTSLALVGAGVTRSGLLFGSGFAWLGSDEQDQAMLVNGATGQGTGRFNLEGEGERLEVRRFGEHTYVVQVGRNGERILYRLDDVDQSAVRRDRPLDGGQVLTRSGDRAWLIDGRAGTLDPVDPETLESRPGAATLRFQGAILDAPDSLGRLIVVEEATARAYVVEETRGEARTVGSPGDPLLVSSVGEHPAVLNGARGEVHIYDEGRAEAVSLPSGRGSLAVAPAGEGDELVVLRHDGARGELLFVNVEQRSVRAPVVVQGGLPRDPGVPYAVDGAVFLIDADAGNALVIDAGSGQVRTVPLGLPADTAPEAFVKDGRLWVNDKGGEKAVIVERDGRHQAVNKYDRKVPEINPAGAPDAPADPPPAPGGNLPNPHGGSTGGTGGPPGGGGPGNGAGPPPVITAPGAPRQFTARGANGRVELSWQAPSDGGSPIAGYTLRCDPDCGRGRSVNVAPGETFTVDGLRNGDTYRFELAARNAVGEGPVARASAQPTADVPPAPTDVRATANPNGTVTLTWQAQAGGLTLTGFQIRATTTASNLTASFEVPGTATTFTTLADQLRYDDDTEPDWSFEVAAVAGGRVGATARSNAADPFKAPDFGSAALTAAPANGQVTLTWPTARANGRPVTYEVARCQNGGCTNVNATVNAGAQGQRTAVVGGLTNGTTYGFRVRPRNEGGTGPELTAQAMPEGQPAIRFTGSGPTGPNGIQATFDITWLGPVGQCRLAAGPAGNLNCGAGTYTAGGLNPSTNYTIRVCATRGGLEGCTTNVTIRTDPPPTYAVTIECCSTAEAFDTPGAGRQVGPGLQPGTTVQVRCRVYDARLSSNAPGYNWYQVATAPWTDAWLAATATYPDGQQPGYDSRIPAC